MFGSFLSPSHTSSFLSHPFPLPATPWIPGRNYFALISNFVEEKSISNNRKDQGFLLVEIRIAIQGVDLHCFPVWFLNCYYKVNVIFKVTKN
jgi:hypothetical protein